MTGILAAGGFAARLRSATRDEHEAAEGAPFVGALMGGVLSVDAYADLLTQLVCVYSVLEENLAAVTSDAFAARFVDERLFRTGPLRADLAALGRTGVNALEVLPATKRYCHRLRHITATSPATYVAHHYTRYLGDLSGGQAIGRAVRRNYPAAGTATSFFRFVDIASPKRFKDEYRQRLDETPWSEQRRSDIADEARRAFRYNHDMLVELGVRHGAGPVAVELSNPASASEQ